MAKISPTSIKYSVLADFQSEGPIEKPDVIGAIFGQTEGLLGSDMELRELQKDGKIGRIDVDLRTENGKTKGEIIIPSALDRTETTIIAAALETIDKIGPTDTKITINEIKDVRGSKRDYIMERAKKLLSSVKDSSMDATEMENQLRESSRTAKIAEYGEERLPAGPNLDNEDEIYVVEGRADVVNLLKHGIKNVIGMDGTRLPQEIARLGKNKELILFVDGDRGGKLIAQNVTDNAKIKSIACAPDGKEVEELTGKEIQQALRKQISVNEFLKKPQHSERYQKRYENREKRHERKAEKSEKEITKEEKSKIRNMSSEIKSKNVLILNENLDVIKNTSTSKLGYLKSSDVYNVFVIMANTVTKKLLETADKIGAKYIAARNFGKSSDVSEMAEKTGIELISV